VVEKDGILLHDSMRAALLSKYANPLDDVQGLPGQQELFSGAVAALIRLLARQFHVQASFRLFSPTLVPIKRPFLSDVELCYFSYSRVATHVAIHAFHVVIGVFTRSPISSIQVDEPQGLISI
jgi:hypothetical protein